jgi:hypothetical protein
MTLDKLVQLHNDNYNIERRSIWWKKKRKQQRNLLLRKM